MALRIASVFFSLSNFAEWTPTTTSSLGYFFSSLARSGSTWMQLMQQNVQKSSKTILPLRSFRRTGPAVFSQATPPSSSGALARCRVARDSALGEESGTATARPAATSAAAARPSRTRTGISESGDMERLHLVGGTEGTGTGRRTPGRRRDIVSHGRSAQPGLLDDEPAAGIHTRFRGTGCPPVLSGWRQAGSPSHGHGQPGV